MKTLYAPDSLSALSATVQDAATSQPVLAFAAVAVACALFARFAARQF